MHQKKHYLFILLAALFLISACRPAPEPSVRATVDAIVDSAAVTSALEAEATSTPTAGTPTITAALSEIVGSVMARANTAESFSAVSDGFTLKPKGQVQTDQDSQVRLDLSDSTLVRLGENSLFTLEAPREEPAGLLSRLRLEVGEIWIILNGGAMQVETSSGEAAVRGSYMYVNFDPDTGEMRVTCLEGSCSLSNEHGTVNFGAGETAVILNADQPPQLGKMTEEDVQDWLDMNPEAILVVSSLTPPATATGTVTPTSTLIWYPLPTSTPKPPPDPITPTVQIDTITPTSAVVGEMISFSVSVFPVGDGPIPTGKVDIKAGGSVVCSATLSSGAAKAFGSCAGLITSSGNHNVQAFFSGDSYYGTNYSVSQNYSVTTASTTTTLDSVSPPSSVTGEKVTVTFTVAPTAPGSGIPTGTVTVSAGPDSCTAAASVGFCDLTLTSAGAKSIVATFAGDSNYLGSVSSSVGHTVTQASTTTDITSFSPNPSNVSIDAVTFNATVDVDLPGSGTPFGSVTFTDVNFTSDFCTVSAAPWTCAITFTQTGARQVEAVYSGDTNFDTSTSTTVIQYVPPDNNTFFDDPVGPDAVTFSVPADCTQTYSIKAADLDGLSNNALEVEYILNDSSFLTTTTKLPLTYVGNATWEGTFLIPFTSSDIVYWRFVAQDDNANPTFYGGGNTSTVGYPSPGLSFVYSFDTTLASCP